MKKIIYLLLLLVAATPLEAQVPDTLTYLKSIVLNKAQYVGQPFSKLKDSLKIQIKFFSPSVSIPHDKTKETSTSFAFYFPVNAEEVYLTYPHLEIYWQPFLDAMQSRSIRSLYRTSGWNQQISNHYSIGTITDIKVLDK